MLNSKVIYRLLFLPFLFGMTFFASVFLTACACQPSSGKQIDFQIITASKPDQKTTPGAILTKFVAQASTALFERKNHQDPLFVEIIKTDKTSDKVEQFLGIFNLNRDLYFNPIKVFVEKTIEYKKEHYPSFVLLPKESNEDQVTFNLKLQYTFAKAWHIAIELKNIVSKFPAQSKSKPTIRFAEKFIFDFKKIENWKIELKINQAN